MSEEKVSVPIVPVMLLMMLSLVVQTGRGRLSRYPEVKIERNFASRVVSANAPKAPVKRSPVVIPPPSEADETELKDDEEDENEEP